LAWRVGARQVPTVEREALQRLVPSPFKLLNKVRAPSSRLGDSHLMSNHQHVILPSAHADAGGGRRNTSAVQIILAARQSVSSQDEIPSVLFGCRLVFDSIAGR